MRAPWNILYQDKYKLTERLVKKASDFIEFANGGSQATIKLKDGTVVREVLLSNRTYIIAIRGYTTLTFSIEDVADIFQSKEDAENEDRKKWVCWVE